MLPTFATVKMEILSHKYLKTFVYIVRKGFDEVSILMMTSQLSDDITTFFLYYVFWFFDYFSAIIRPILTNKVSLDVS